jgi:hypothetical protein
MIGDFVYGNTTLGGLLVPAAIRGVVVSVQVVQLSEALGKEIFAGEGVFSQVLQLSEGLAKESFIGAGVFSQPDQFTEGLGMVIAQPVPIPLPVYRGGGGPGGFVQVRIVPQKQKIRGEAQFSNLPQEVYAVGLERFAGIVETVSQRQVISALGNVGLGIILLAERRRRREEHELIKYLMAA